MVGHQPVAAFGQPGEARGGGRRADGRRGSSRSSGANAAPAEKRSPSGR